MTEREKLMNGLCILIALGLVFGVLSGIVVVISVLLDKL